METFSSTRIHCECHLDKLIEKSEELLEKYEHLLQDGKKHQALQKMQENLKNLQTLQKKHMEWKADYARELVDLVKVRTLNVGPRQTKMQTVPYLTGREKREKQEEKETKGRKKSKKN